MKKSFILFLLLVSGLFVRSQCNLFSPGFEQWKTDTIISFTGDTFYYEHPEGWYSFLDILGYTFGDTIPAIQRSKNARTGKNALKVALDSGEIGNGLSISYCPQKIMGVKGYYKMDASPGDTFAVSVYKLDSGRNAFSGDTSDALAYGMFLTTQPTSGYEPFRITMNYFSGDPGDSLFISITVINHAGKPLNIWVDDVEIEKSSSIKQVENLPGVKLYPNPGKGLFNVFIPSAGQHRPVQLRIIDPAGRVKYSRSITPGADGNHQTLDLRDFPRGIYFLKVHGGKYREIKKVVIR